ncbi:MAG: translation elongation factor Ts [Verrucomicrobiales bacterium]|nr:translation elongation factor Ts [Verrucomicrobiales bacterium]MCP5528218.1 translation elongation factor Ts [Verrucomicrobiales bacterium]
MAEITAQLVMKLRQITNAGMMDCKKALLETSGDLDAAVDLLRKKGMATAAKKASREAREGAIAQCILPGSRAGVLVEVNCETDFVAKNEMFRTFADQVARTLAEDSNADLEALRTDAVARIRENIQITRHHRLEVEGPGLVAGYIHTGAKVGVLAAIGCGKAETAEQEAFRQLVRDITLQIAAGSPVAIAREQVDPALLEKEKEIYANSEAVKNKPPQAVAKIIEGKLEKFLQGICLVDQGFVKRNSEVSVKEQVAEVARELGDEVTIRSFVRFQVGES